MLSLPISEGKFYMLRIKFVQLRTANQERCVGSRLGLPCEMGIRDKSRDKRNKRHDEIRDEPLMLEKSMRTAVDAPCATTKRKSGDEAKCIPPPLRFLYLFRFLLNRLQVKVDLPSILEVYGFYYF